MTRPLLNRLLLCLMLLPAATAVAQQSPAPADPVVISGAVPDEATKAALLGRLKDVYGAANVVDQLTVGGVTMPPDWSSRVPRLVTTHLKAVSKGQLVVEGSNVTIRGEVASDSLRQAIAGEVAGILSNRFVVHDGLRVTAASQNMLDRALANRVIEFEPGSALLTEEGRITLDEIMGTLKSVNPKRIEVIGHTDNVGDPDRNMALSRARADSVKIYLVAHGMAPERIGTSGMGQDQPIMPNTTEEGRRRNRRIEFRISQQ